MSNDSRFANIGNILSSPPKPQRRLTSVDDVAATETPSGKPAAPKKPVSTPPASAAAGGTRRVAFRLPAELHQALTERVSLDSTNQSHVVLDAIEDAHTRGTIDTLLLDNAKAGSTESGGLFARPRLRGHAAPTVTTEIRLDASTLGTLDQLADHHGAETRTQLITATLEAYLR